MLAASCQLNKGGSDTSASGGSATTASDGGSNGGPSAAGGGTVSTSSDGNSLVQSPRYIGRVSTSTNMLTWAGTAVEASFTGTGGTAIFSGASGSNYLGVSIDGGNITSVAVNNPNTQVPFGPVASGNHVVRFTKLSEPELGTVTFQSISITGGKLMSYAPPSRRIEVVGDSISVGYGVLGTAPCTNTAATEDNTKAWGWLTANKLNADLSCVAWSGRGLYRNGVGVTDTNLMPNYWQQLSATDTNTPYTFPAASAPQAVVVNLGTNDYTYIGYDANGTAYNARSMLDQTAFTSAYLSFVQQIRQAYPNALIVLATSPMLTDTYPTATEKEWTSLLDNVQSVVSQMGDANVTTLSIPTQNTTVTGCDGHPDPTEQQSMASLLTTLLQQKLNW